MAPNKLWKNSLKQLQRKMHQKFQIFHRFPDVLRALSGFGRVVHRMGSFLFAYVHIISAIPFCLEKIKCQQNLDKEKKKKKKFVCFFWMSWNASRDSTRLRLQDVWRDRICNCCRFLFFYRSSIHQFIFDRRSCCTQGLWLVVRSNPGKVVLSIIFSLKSIWIKQLETEFMTGQKKIITSFQW